MRRSLLFIPSNTPAMLQNADVFAADAVIFDLEDAVLLSEKDAALNLLNQFLSLFPLGSVEKVVRINGLDSSLGFVDLTTIVTDKIDTIMLPKATKEMTLLLVEVLRKIEKKTKMTKKIGIIPIIEKASSVLEVADIAKIERVNGLLLGGEDLATDLEVQRTENGLEILFSRQIVILAAKANQIDAIDTPYTNTTNQSGFESDSEFAKSLGMNAKACIHPIQIETVNKIFSPKVSEIEYALKVIAAYEAAILEKRGAFSVDGKMVDKPVIERAQKVIEKAKLWNLL
ncbi:MAG: aldolase/citrate lyase family protein [Acholeplasmataceae bacterium]|nr:aldolase/citrate lyase family protein [Acholeplasmataceae bacterium]